MHRLFVGLRPPAANRAELLALAGGVEGARWQVEEQLHLTLCFAGEVPADLAEDAATQLGRVRMAPFPLALRGVGHFERKGMPGTLWAGIAPSDPLRMLQGQVERACRRAGLEPERRKFHPHITLARLSRVAGPIGSWLAAHGAFRGGEWLVDHMILYESHLAPSGSEYEPVVRYALRG